MEYHVTIHPPKWWLFRLYLALWLVRLGTRLMPQTMTAPKVTVREVQSDLLPPKIAEEIRKTLH